MQVEYTPVDGSRTPEAPSAEWECEHSWRTWIFMTMDHMYYSRLAWAIGALLCLVTIASCTAFVMGTAPTYR